MTAKSNEQPRAVPQQPAQNGFSLISSEKLLQLYSTMLKCRMIEDSTRILFNNNAFPAITVDGNDIVAVYRVASEAIAHARKGNGPTLIECQTGRSDGHSEIGSGKFRDPAEVERWKAGDPILKMEKYLIRKGLFSEEFKKQIAGEFSKELNAAIESADKLPLQPKQLKNLRALC
ncbi:MAG: thiamine pyrophosphate-dependent enzyme [Terracidiphilus sp.]|jgi:TPP-dependent pyruvate/acetoin dehydrogenase alpha subunit